MGKNSQKWHNGKGKVVVVLVVVVVVVVVAGHCWWQVTVTQCMQKSNSHMV